MKHVLVVYASRHGATRGIAERLGGTLPVSNDLLPIGDFRDWPAIEGWAVEIARDLVGEPIAVG
ncbi:MAG: flavodoxin domain-containing protein [Chloroflexi bacterium]|nr:flavodoxin domain-containing protein [Chloroflexota bacterium]